MRKQWETLVGDDRKLDYLAHVNEGSDADEHPLQKEMEELIDTLLTDKEKEVYYMRFGQRMPHRDIAAAMGFKSHYNIQFIEQRIMDKIRKALDASDTANPV